jgi:serine/threonine protein kinase/tetratricopeptide (TPR) repeat protein
MKGDDGAAVNVWGELETLWEMVSDLPPDEREALLASRAVEGELRAELDSLLSRASAAEAFFDRLAAVVPEASHAAAFEGLNGDADAVAQEDGSGSVDSDPLVGMTLGRYQIIERLGQGGMGVVYRALDLQLRRTVALKLVRARTSNDARAKERLLAEARAAAALDHPNICTIYEIGETPEMAAFIAMGFYPGRTLAQALERGPLSLMTALDYVTQIARGLGAAHERGIIHRDVKPANVIVTADGVVKLLDFGIARMTDVDVSRDGVTPGTIAYMSPEQVTSRPLDQRTDLWSLGVVFYEMLAGERPFRGESAGAVLYAILEQPPPLVSTLRRDVPARIDAVVARLLARDPAHRYGSAEEVIAAVSSNRDDDGSPARPATPLSKPHRPHRRWTRRILYGVATLAVGAAIVSWPIVAKLTRGTDQRTTLASNDVVSPERTAAMDLYAQARQEVLFRTDSGRRYARDLFQQAIAADSTFAAAHAGLALMALTPGDHSNRSIVSAEASARTAVRLDSMSPEAHAALGRVLFSHYRLVEAEKHLKRAVELDGPQTDLREFLIWLYAFMDRRGEVLEQATLFERNKPGGAIAIAELARGLLVNGRCDEALAQLDRLKHLRPPPARAGNYAAQCFAMRKQWPQAIDAISRVAQTNEQAIAYLGFMLARGGHTDSARVIRDRLLAQMSRGNGSAYGLGVVYAGLGDFDSAFEWFEKSYADRSLRPDIMGPIFDDVRRDPRFEKLRAKLGIPNR